MVDQAGKTSADGRSQGTIFPARRARPDLHTRQRRYSGLLPMGGPLREKRLRRFARPPTRRRSTSISAVMLKAENKVFKIEKHTHSYPHCWRTDKPVLYYPLDSWFIRTTALRDRMIELNKTIRWKPAIDRNGTLRQVARRSGGLEPLALALLGHAAADLGNGGLLGDEVHRLGRRARRRDRKIRRGRSDEGESLHRTSSRATSPKRTTRPTGSTCTVLTWTISCWFPPKENRCGANRI